MGMNGSEKWQLGVQITDTINKRTLGCCVVKKIKCNKQKGNYSLLFSFFTDPFLYVAFSASSILPFFIAIG